MLRRKPTRQPLDQTDIEHLDLIRKEFHEKAAAAAVLRDPSKAPVTDKTPREQAVQGASIRERLGLPRRTTSSQ